MHFSIPDCEELHDAYGSAYTSYKIYCNGAFVGSTRYREFSDLNEDLKEELGVAPSFPPKKLFHLSATEQRSRKVGLEKYLQTLGQSAEALNSRSLQFFLKKILLRSLANSADQYDFQICLPDGKAVDVEVDSTNTTAEVTEIVARRIRLPEDVIFYFGLFLARDDEHGYSIVRKFAAFEYPIAIASLNEKELGPLRLIYKKAYWDTSYDRDVMQPDSHVPAEILSAEVINAVARNWILTASDQRSKLEALHRKRFFEELVVYASSLKGYGTLHFEPCVIDYPSSKLSTRPYMTGRELVCPLSSGELVFKITRMRCWRLGLAENAQEISGPREVSVMFEYLIDRDTLKWITITSKQAVWMSSCLQSAVEELLKKKSGTLFTRPKIVNGSPPESARDRTEESLSVSVSVSRALPSNNSAFEIIGDDDL